MWVALRATFGILIVCVIVVIVVSPYVDLPLTTLRVWQTAIRILTVLALCWAAAAGWHLLRRTEPLSPKEVGLRSLHDRDLLGLTCALRC